MRDADLDLLDSAIALLRDGLVPREAPVPVDPPIALPAALPETGLGERAALERLAPAALGGAAQLHHRGYFAHMDPPTPPVAWAGALWQAALNQNTLHPDAAPAARALERRAVDWLAPAFGMDGGHLVPGSTIANLTALWAAREIAGVTRVVVSSRAHLSVRKAADLLGLRCERIEGGPDHAMLPEHLPDLTGAALVLTAGTVSTGAVDTLDRGGAAWVHVDAAWAGPLRLSDRYAHLLDGVEKADSVGLSAHKWLYQPKGAALVMFRHAARAHEAMTYGGGYLAAPNVGLLGSAPATALPLLATLLAWGREGVARRLEADMARADRLIERIGRDERFELWGPNRTGVVVLRPRTRGAAQVRDRLSDAWMSLTDIDGETWLRAVAANPNADPDHVFDRLVAAL